MENFNKNWLAILLVAVVFGTLGFLLGRSTADRHDYKEMRLHADGENEFMFEDEDGGENEDEDGTTVKIDTVMKDGKRVITKEVRKIKKD